MKTSTVIIGIFVGLTGIVITGILVCIMSYVSAQNAANGYEQGIKYAWENNKSVLDNYKKRVAEAAQVPAMQTEDLLRIFSGANAARYGKDGSQAGMQWIKEQNPNIDQKTYVEIQRIISAGRIQFTKEQTALLDRKRAYETALGSFWSGTWMRIAGYPKINLNDYKIVITSQIEESFTMGRDEKPMSLR